jgi:hypothetical protein
MNVKVGQIWEFKLSATDISPEPEVGDKLIITGSPSNLIWNFVNSRTKVVGWVTFMALNYSSDLIVEE